MHVDRIIGSTGIRVATLAVSLLLVTVVVLREHPIASGARDALFFLVVGGSVLAFIGLIHCFRVLYSRWLTFAGFLQQLVVALLFGSCYIFIVPCFYLIMRVIDLRRARSRSALKSFWILRRRVECDAKYLTRMG
jgi:hypothetical protein